MLAPERPIWDKADEIKEVEHKCDFLTHEIIQRLNRTFVTPLDREDIHALARSLDDVMDAIDASRRHRPALPDRARPPGRARAGRASSAHSVDQLVKALKALEKKDGRRRAGGRDQPARERGRPRAPGRRPQRSSTRSATRSPIIKWKEILDFLEDATDRCEDVANVLEGVVVKHA